MSSIRVVEVWKKIPGFPSYEVSDFGRVRKGQKILSQSKLLGKEYLRVGLLRDGKWISKRVHRLVLEAFVGPCPDGQEARHLNDVGSDNRLTNLSWGTKAQNTEDRDRNNKTPRGSRVTLAKIDESIARRIKDSLDKCSTYGSVRRLAKNLNVPEHIIYKIKQGKTWSHV